MNMLARSQSKASVVWLDVEQIEELILQPLERDGIRLAATVMLVRDTGLNQAGEGLELAVHVALIAVAHRLHQIAALVPLI